MTNTPVEYDQVDSLDFLILPDDDTVRAINAGIFDTVPKVGDRRDSDVITRISTRPVLTPGKQQTALHGITIPSQFDAFIDLSSLKS